MNTDQILKVLKAERDCIKNAEDYCYEECGEYCPYYVPEKEKLEVYDFLINGYELLQNEGAESYMIKCKEPLSEEQIARFKEEWGNASFTASFEPISLPDNLKAVILGESVDEYGREHFKGICPYIGKKCEKWTCNTSEVEAREHKFAEGDAE